MAAAYDIHAGKAAHLGRSLRGWRAFRRVKQAHAAELLCVSQAQVSRWESGAQVPGPDSCRRIGDLIGARLDSAGDRAIVRLVRQSARPVHLVCDMSHRLLAASPARIAQFRVDPADLMGRLLRPAAGDDIRRAEATLGERGWFDDTSPAVEAFTQAVSVRFMFIPASRFRWTRIRFSDGSFGRIIETLACLPAPDQTGSSR